MMNRLFSCFGYSVWIVASVLLNSVQAEPVITGAGSTAAAPIYQAWAAQYQKQSGVSLSYDAIGSSAGMKKIAADAVSFGATDAAPSEAKLNAAGLVLIPVAITGITPVLNLPPFGASSDAPLQLNGEVLARIFSGELNRWNAAPIAELNPQWKLPDMPITVVVRSDGSGTTANFTDYLSKVSPRWRNQFGSHASIDWPATFTAVKGSASMATTVRNTLGAIGYVDFGYVQGSRLATAHLPSAEGDWVAPNVDSFKAALTHSDWIRTGHVNTSLTLQPGKGAWPITMGTFAVVPQASHRPEETLRVLKFLAWSFMQGDRLVAGARFVRLPDRVQAAAFKAMSSVREQNGAPLGTQILAP